MTGAGAGRAGPGHRRLAVEQREQLPAGRDRGASPVEQPGQVGERPHHLDCQERERENPGRGGPPICGQRRRTDRRRRDRQADDPGGDQGDPHRAQGPRVHGPRVGGERRAVAAPGTERLQRRQPLQPLEEARRELPVDLPAGGVAGLQRPPPRERRGHHHRPAECEHEPGQRVDRGGDGDRQRGGQQRHRELRQVARQVGLECRDAFGQQVLQRPRRLPHEGCGPQGEQVAVGARP